MSSNRGTYYGPFVHLRGKTAMLQPVSVGTVAAQFDDTTAERNGEKLGYGWHLFDASDFEIIKDPFK